MPFRATFDCLWCGTAHATRTPDDIEGWAALCPECLGNAQDNGFLKMRLRKALADRARAQEPPAPTRGSGSDVAGPTGMSPPSPVGPVPDHDDFYLRQGRFSRGPLHDGPWSMELDEVTRWLDGLPIDGTIVELEAGTGWWSGLLAEKGELWVYDENDAALELARKRLVAHGLMAHLHQRDAMAAADKSVDVVVGAYLLGRRPSASAVREQLGIAAGWLAADGLLVLVEAAAPSADDQRLPGPGGPIRGWTGVDIEAELAAAGFEDVDVRATSSAFVMAQARRPRLEP